MRPLTRGPYTKASQTLWQLSKNGWTTTSLTEYLNGQKNPFDLLIDKSEKISILISERMFSFVFYSKLAGGYSYLRGVEKHVTAIVFVLCVVVPPF